MTLQPYQIFFPLSFFYGIYGISIWALFYLNIIPYPGFIHSYTMSQGFMASLAAGFLLTLVPRFTNKKPASAFEIFFVFLVQCFPILSLFKGIDMGEYIHFFMGGYYLYLILFFFRRRITHTLNTPVLFDLIPFAVLAGLIGSVMSICIHLQYLPPVYYYVTKILTYQVFPLLLVIAVCDRMISTIHGWNFNESQTNIFLLKVVPHKWARIIIFLTLVTSIVADCVQFHWLAHSMRTVACVWAAIVRWKIYKIPPIKNKILFSIWISSIGLLLGMVIAAVFPGLHINAFHMIFISGYSALLLTVASRVTLAHGGFEMELETKATSVMITAVFFLVAAAMRLFASFIPVNYYENLAIASVLWLIAALFWGFAFLPKILYPLYLRVKNGNQRPSNL